MNKALHLSPAFIFVLFLFSTGVSFAQSNDLSPYSRYGIGDLQEQSSSLNFSMGGTGIAYHNDGSTPFFINLKNPASYAYGFIPIQDSSGTSGLKMAAFEAGLIDNILHFSTEGQTASSNNAYLAYIAINIPVSRHFGLAAGLTPVSTEGYSINSTSTIDSNNKAGYPLTTAQNIYQGSGGINKVYIGAAYSPIKNISFGVNLSYLFGTLNNEEYIDFPENLTAFNTSKTEQTTIHSFYADFGMMYTFKPFGDWSVTLGATLAPSLNLNSNYNILVTSQYSNQVVGAVYNIDTVIDSNANGKIKMPLMIGGGLTIKKGDHLTISFDYTMQNWSQYSYFGENQDLSNSYTYGVGIQYIPNKDFPKSYMQRIHYRIGFSYGESYVDLYNTQLTQKSFSAGVGIPIGPSNPYNHPAVLNIGMQVGSYGTTANNLIQQNFVKLMFSFTFDDHWFDKRMFQ